MFFKRRNNKNFYQIYKMPNISEQFALIALNGDMRDKLLSHLKMIYSQRGSHIQNGGKASPIPMLTLLGSGTGALGLTAATSGTLFMATANPATLMAIGSGVGSAVMGTGGIVAQAPFIPVAGALVPVVFSLLAFNALTTIVLLNQFKSIGKQLNEIAEAVHRVLQRNEATFIGEVISANSKLDNLEQELEFSNQFTDDMIIRLALIEEKVNPMFERYRSLYEARNINKSLTSEDLLFKQLDAYMAIILSILDLKIDVLRGKLLIQENPGFISKFGEMLVTKVKQYKKFWADVETSPKRVAEVSQELRDAIESMSWWQKHMPDWLFGSHTERKDTQARIKAFDSMNSVDNTKDLLDAVKVASNVGEGLLEHKETVSLIYWEDEFGKHSYYSSDIAISSAKPI
jgi:hypothetical protein